MNIQADINDVMYISIKNERINKAYGDKIIVINTLNNNANKLLTVANGIRYYIMNSYIKDNHTIKNDELNKFAMALLMDKTIFSSGFKKLMHLQKYQIIDKLSNIFFVLQRCIIYHINELNLG